MLQELADKSENQGLKMNKSKTKVMMENDTPIYVNNTQIENVASYIYLGQRYSTRYKNQDKKNHGLVDSIRQAARHLQGQYWNMLEETSLQLMRTSSNDIRRGNMGTRHPSTDQTSSRTNKYGKEYAKNHIPEQKNKHLGNRKDKGHRRKWVWAGYVSRIRDKRWTRHITIWKPYERKS